MKTEKSKAMKIMLIVTSILGIWILLGIILAASGDNKPPVSSSSSTSQRTTIDEVKTPPPVDPSIEKAKHQPGADAIKVESAIIKKVGGKYRYFFNVKNTATHPFQGNVKVVLISHDGKFDMDLDFDNLSIQPALQKTGYLDLNTGPTETHGTSGIAKYKYEVSINNISYDFPEQPITDKREDLSDY